MAGIRIRDARDADADALIGLIAAVYVRGPQIRELHDRSRSVEYYFRKNLRSL